MLIIQAAKRENKRRPCRNDHQSKLLFREKKKYIGKRIIRVPYLDFDHFHYNEVYLAE